jgi:hypothetical protein
LHSCSCHMILCFIGTIYRNQKLFKHSKTGGHTKNYVWHEIGIGISR